MKNRMLLLLCLSLFCSTSLFGKELKDVAVLELKEQEEKVVVKMRPAGELEESFFYVRLSKKDPTFKEKYQLFKKKIEQKVDNKLNLEIKSFSSKLPGSSYPAEHVTIK